MTWLLIVCASTWQECDRPVMLPRPQCEAVLHLALSSQRAMCVTSTGGVIRQREFASNEK